MHQEIKEVIVKECQLSQKNLQFIYNLIDLTFWTAHIKSVFIILEHWKHEWNLCRIETISLYPS